MLNMKKILLLSIFFFSFSLTFAQDTILKRNNDKIVAKIFEISPTEVKYKKYDFQDGPTYIDKKSDIKMIVFANGMKEAFEEEKPKQVIVTNNTEYIVKKDNNIEDYKMHYRYQGHTINQPQMQKILMDTKDKQIIGLVSKAKDARKMEFISFAAIPLAAAAFILVVSPSITGSPSSNDNLPLAGVCLVAGIACPIISGVNKGKKMRYNSDAIILYNQKY